MVFTFCLSGMPHPSARVAGFCEMPITAKDIRDAMKAYARDKSPGSICQTCSLVSWKISKSSLATITLSIWTFKVSQHLIFLAFWHFTRLMLIPFISMLKF